MSVAITFSRVGNFINRVASSVIEAEKSPIYLNRYCREVNNFHVNHDKKGSDKSVHNLLLATAKIRI